MKNKVWILIALLSLMISALALQKHYSIQENVLYAQSVVSDNERQVRDTSEVVTRIQAINRAYEVFREALGINLYSSDITMYINLYHDQAQKNYQWVMSWYAESTGETYSCSIATESGQILTLYVYEKEKLSDFKGIPPLSRKSLENSIRHFTRIIGRDIDEYKIIKRDTIRNEDTGVQHCYATFRNKEDDTDQFILEWNAYTGVINSYEIKTGEET